MCPIKMLFYAQYTEYETEHPRTCSNEDIEGPCHQDFQGLGAKLVMYLIICCLDKAYNLTETLRE